MTDLQQCTAVTVSGKRCSHVHGVVAGVCRWHDPARRDALRLMRQKGAAAAAASRVAKRRIRAALASETAGPRPEVGRTLESLSDFGRWLMEAAVRRELDKGETVALMSGLRVLENCYSKRDLEQRLRVLQRSYEALKRKMERDR